MIRLLQEGKYKLIETKNQIKILTLDGSTTYAWIHIKNIGEILLKSHREHAEDHILALGSYRVYEVLDEEFLADTTHLELFVGNDTWQGYLLITGFPTDKKKRSRIIPTKEIITKINPGNVL